MRMDGAAEVHSTGSVGGDPSYLPSTEREPEKEQEQEQEQEQD